MKLIIRGAGGYGHTVADIAEQSGEYEEIHFLDDNANANNVIGKCVDFVKLKIVQYILLLGITKFDWNGLRSFWQKVFLSQL